MNVLVAGASGGIGSSVVNYFSKNGIKVFALDLMEKEFGENVEFIKANLTDISDLEGAFLRLKSDGVVLDAIVNVAGVFEIDSFIEADYEALRRVFEVNFMGAITLNKIMHPLLKENGRIVVTTSDVAPLDPLPFNGIYSVSKTALDAYTQSLRQELNLIGQKVITIRPGAFDTALSRGSLVKTELLMKKTELYKKQSARFYSLVKKFMGKPLSTEKAVKIYYKAVTKKRPKIIYKKHPSFLLKLMSILPKRLQCFIIKKLLK